MKKNLIIRKKQKSCTFNRVSKPLLFLDAVLNENTYNLVCSSTSARLPEKQLTMFERFLKRRIKRKRLKLNITARANAAVSKKPSEIRMGKGKGAINYLSCKVYPGFRFGYFHGITSNRLTKFISKVNKKLCIKLFVVSHKIFKDLKTKKKV